MTTPRRLLLAALTLYALIFVGLSADIMMRVWDWRARFESPVDAAALLYFEGMRTLVTLAGIALALHAAARARFRAGLVELPFLLLLATIAYTKLVAFRGFPGEYQTRLAIALHEAAVPTVLLEVIFAQPAWTAWLALAGTMLLLAHFPRALSPADLAESGSADRRGALREVAVAGTDVGQLSRSAAAGFSGSRWNRPTALYLAAAAVAALHLLIARGVDGSARLAVQVTALAVAAVAVAVCVALFRAGSRAAAGADAVVLAWLRRAALAGGGLFVVAGVSALAVRGGIIPVAALSLVPVVVLAGVAAAVRHTPPYGRVGVDAQS